MKERDFYNNIVNPDDGRSITVDGQMVGALTGTGLYPDKQSNDYNVIMKGPSAAAEHNQNGCYPACVDAITNAADALSQTIGTEVTPVEFQAMDWIYTKERTEAPGNLDRTTMATMGNPSATPVGQSIPATPPQGRDVTDMNDAMAIVATGPSDSAIGPIQTIAQAERGSVSDKVLANYEYTYSESAAQECKADVATRIADNCTASTPDLTWAAVPPGFFPDDVFDHEMVEDAMVNPEDPFAPQDQVSQAADQAMREAAVSQMVSGWAGTSNDSNPMSLAMHCGSK